MYSYECSLSHCQLPSDLAATRMVEAGHRTTEFEAVVKKAVAAAGPFTAEGGADLTEA